jgi:hypothetical protein
MVTLFDGWRRYPKTHTKDKGILKPDYDKVVRIFVDASFAGDWDKSNGSRHRSARALDTSLAACWLLGDVAVHQQLPSTISMPASKESRAPFVGSTDRRQALLRRTLKSRVVCSARPLAQTRRVVFHKKGRRPQGGLEDSNHIQV